MISLKINCFDTKEQTEEFVHWFVNTGEALFNEAISKNIKPISVDFKSTFDNKKVMWSGNTSLIVLKENSDLGMEVPELKKK